MRTTLTIEDDIARELQRLERSTNRRRKDVVNDLLRKGLAAGQRPPARPARYRVRARSSGFRPGLDLLKMNQLADELELEDGVGRAARPRSP